MIKYNFGKVKCKIEFDKFLKIEINNIIKYKNGFKSFSDLYELIEKQKNNINHILFDGYEYFLENGLLHNLYGPAKILYGSENVWNVNGESYFFYIDGKLVHDNINNTRGCKKLESFKNEKIFFHKEITGKRTGKDKNTGFFYKRKEGVDYNITIINLEEIIKKDQRFKKLKKINKKN